MRRGIQLLLPLVLAGFVALGLYLFVGYSTAPARQPLSEQRARLGIPYAATGELPGQGAPGPGYPGDRSIPPEVGRISQAAPLPLQQIMRREHGVLELILTDAGIRPPEIRVRVGDQVKLHVINRGGRLHNLVVPDFSVFGHNLQPGDETYVQFRANRSGRFPYFSDTGHENVPEPGLEGTLQVSP